MKAYIKDIKKNPNGHDIFEWLLQNVGSKKRYRESMGAIVGDGWRVTRLLHDRGNPYVTLVEIDDEHKMTLFLLTWPTL